MQRCIISIYTVDELKRRVIDVWCGLDQSTNDGCVENAGHENDQITGHDFAGHEEN